MEALKAMMNYLLGSTDPSVAFAFIAMMGGLTVVTTALIVRRRSTLELSNEFELKKIEFKLGDEKSKRQVAKERDVELGSIASKREIEFKRIDKEGTIDVTANGRRPIPDNE